MVPVQCQVLFFSCFSSSLLVTTSKALVPRSVAPVTTSVALVPSSFLLLLVRHLLLLAWHLFLGLAEILHFYPFLFSSQTSMTKRPGTIDGSWHGLALRSFVCRSNDRFLWPQIPEKKMNNWINMLKLVCLEGN